MCGNSAGVCQVDSITIDGRTVTCTQGSCELSTQHGNVRLFATDTYSAEEVYTPVYGRWNSERYAQIVRRILTQDIFSTQAGGVLREFLRAGPLSIMPNHQPRARNATCVRMGARNVRLLIEFTPANFGPSRSGPDANDAVLFHELVHAVRHMQGVYSPMPAHSFERYTNTEEFHAVVVTNIYLSSIGSRLRHGHAGHEALSNPETWFNHPRNQRMIARMSAEQPCFAWRLSQVQAPFNPFREHYARQRARFGSLIEAELCSPVASQGSIP